MRNLVLFKHEKYLLFLHHYFNASILFRVYEKIMEKMMDVAKENKGLKKSIAQWAKAACTEHHDAVMSGKPGGGLSYNIASKTIMKAIHKKLGFERTTGVFSVFSNIFQYSQRFYIQPIDHES